VRERVNGRMRADALLMRSVIVSVISGGQEATDQLNNTLDRLTHG